MHFAILLIALPFVVTVAFVFLPISRGSLVMIFSLLRADPGKIVCSAPNICLIFNYRPKAIIITITIFIHFKET